MLVPGFDRRLFEAVRDSIYVGPGGQSGVDWVAAPVSVLQALGGYEEAEAWELTASRLEGGEGLVPPEEIDPALQNIAVVTSYRVDALVSVNEALYRRRRWVNRAASGADGLPWHFFRTEAVAAASSLEKNGMAIMEGLNAGN